ncbi:17423_t:CDS:2 [Dentiscutata erythropus]|uniref:17423_t:CDS:1 n=1 Tax=Dentiscutata erythropus TaxID=1348616 RepID=A0A9N9IRI2_9GLOM|nr:17423_t:CDS:2 [Dentiscutata erythropus]
MAKQSDKKIAQENLKCLSNLKWGFIIVNAIYVCFRILYCFETFGFGIATLYFVTLGISMFLGAKLKSLGSPRFGPGGNVEWPGTDLNSKGMMEYMFDIIYVTWAVHIGSMFYEGVWWFYLLIPLYALYKIWTLFIQPSMFSGNEGTIPQEKSNRQKKMEKRQSKR